MTAGIGQERGLVEERRPGACDLEVLLRPRVRVVGLAARGSRVEEPSRQAFGIPGELLAAAAQHRVHDAAHGLTVLGVERAGDDLDFFQQRAIEPDGVRVVERVVHAHAVDLILHLVLSPTAEMAVDHASLQIHDVLQLLHRQLLDLLARNDRDGARAVDLDDRTFRGDHHFCHLHRRFLEYEVESSRLVGRDEDTRRGDGSIADESGANAIRTRGDVDDREVAVGVTHGAQLHTDHGDVDARERLLLAVQHPTRDATRRAGGHGQCNSHEPEQRERGHREPGEPPAPCPRSDPTRR